MSGSGQRGSSRPSGVTEVAQAVQRQRVGQAGRDCASRVRGRADSSCAAANAQLAEGIQAVPQLFQLHVIMVAGEEAARIQVQRWEGRRLDLSGSIPEHHLSAYPQTSGNSRQVRELILARASKWRISPYP